MWSGHSASKSGEIHFWDTTRYKRTSQFFNQDGVTCMLPGPQTMAVGTKDGKITLMNIDTHELQAVLEYHTDAIRSLCMVGLNYFASGSSSKDGTIGVWSFD